MNESMIIRKMADQRRYDIPLVFTMILCGRNFCVASNEVNIDKVAPIGFIKSMFDLKMI